MARDASSVPAPAPLPVVSFQIVEDPLSTKPTGVHDHTARSYGFNDTSDFQRPESYIRYIEPLEIDLAGQVEYDMDEQDKAWLDAVNADRKKEQSDSVSYETFEIAMDRLEKDWFDLTKNIPKPDFAMPSEDSTCAICDDSEGENSNAIVFCDGCNLAVHQDCYGVPYIPEGQWLCRKCTVSPEATVSCILCPNEGGGFKQTTSGEWVHLLCAIWIPETRVANEVFMEPVTGVDKISKQRWKLNCTVCKIREGACIQCSKTSCFTAFHATCARKERLLLPMKAAHGAEPVTLTCYCDKHLPKEQQEARAAYFASNADEQADLPSSTGHTPSKLSASSKTARAYAKTYKAGPPPVPALLVSRLVEYCKDPKRKKIEFMTLLCKYWSLKREARRGAPLLKRLHLEPWTAARGAAGGANGTANVVEREMKLGQLKLLMADMVQLQLLASQVYEREKQKLKQAREVVKVLDASVLLRQRVLRNIFERLLNHDRRGYFKDPVSRAEVPDYFDIIKQPMYWTTIEKKLEQYEYWNVQDFQNDVELLIKNAINYNKPQSLHHKAAVRLRTAADPIFKAMRKELQIGEQDGGGDGLGVMVQTVAADVEMLEEQEQEQDPLQQESQMDISEGEIMIHGEAGSGASAVAASAVEALAGGVNGTSDAGAQELDQEHPEVTPQGTEDRATEAGSMIPAQERPLEPLSVEMPPSEAERNGIATVTGPIDLNMANDPPGAPVEVPVANVAAGSSQSVRHVVEDLEPPLELLNLLMDCDGVLSDSTDIIVDDSPFAFLLKYELPKAKPPPPPPPPPPSLPKSKRKRDKKAEKQRKRQEREKARQERLMEQSVQEAEVQENARVSKAKARVQPMAAEEEEELAPVPIDSGMEGAEAIVQEELPPVQNEAQVEALERAPASIDMEVHADDAGSGPASISIASQRPANRKRQSTIPGGQDIPPLVDEVDSQRSFMMFNEGWILPPDQKRRSGKTPVQPRQQQQQQHQQQPTRPVGRPKKRKIDPGPSRLSVVSTESHVQESHDMVVDRQEPVTDIRTPVPPNPPIELPLSPLSARLTSRRMSRVFLPPPPPPRAEVQVVHMENGTVILEELDTPLIRRKKNKAKKQERLAAAAAAAAATAAGDIAAGSGSATAVDNPFDPTFTAAADETTVRVVQDPPSGDVAVQMPQPESPLQYLARAAFLEVTQQQSPPSSSSLQHQATQHRPLSSSEFYGLPFPELTPYRHAMSSANVANMNPPMNATTQEQGTSTIRESNTTAMHEQGSTIVFAPVVSSSSWPGSISPESRTRSPRRNEEESELSELSDDEQLVEAVKSGEHAAKRGRKPIIREITRAPPELRPPRVPPLPVTDPNAGQGIIMIPEGTMLEEGTLVWAKHSSYPWWPSVVCDENDETIVPDDVYLRLQKARQKPGAGVLHLVQFFDKLNSWQFLSLDKLRQLGENDALDQDLISKKSLRQKWTSKTDRDACVFAYGRAIEAMESDAEKKKRIKANFNHISAKLGQVSVPSVPEVPIPEQG